MARQQQPTHRRLPSWLACATVRGMGFFSNLFHGAGPSSNDGNPMRDWAEATGECPQVSFDRQAIESFGSRLRFGDGLEAARLFGRPDIFTPGEASFTLTYKRWGLSLGFELESSHRQRTG